MPCDACTKEVLAMSERQNNIDADHFEHANGGRGPDVMEEIDNTDLEALLLARRAAAAADAALEGAVRAARSHGTTREAIGAVLGITRQAAHTRFSRRT